MKQTCGKSLFCKIGIARYSNPTTGLPPAKRGGLQKPYAVLNSVCAVRKNTPADELVAASGNADALCRERESIAERFRHEVQLRVNEKLHGEGSAGSP